MTGGYDNQGTNLGAVEVFNGSVWRVLNLTHDPVYHHCLASWHSHMVILTGGMKDHESFQSHSLLLRLDSDEVQRLPDMRSPRAFHGCAATEHGYVVAGGSDGVMDMFGGFGYLHTVDYYTFPQPSNTEVLGSWNTLPQLPRARQYTGVVYSYGQLIVVGENYIDPYPSSSLYTHAYNWDQVKWEEWEDQNNSISNLQLVMEIQVHSGLR